MPEHRLPTSDSLRRAALQRSALRGAEVARKRLRWRWAAWGVRMLLAWVVLPAALLAAAAWFWQGRGTAHAGGWPAAEKQADAPSPPASAGTALRLDSSQMFTTGVDDPRAQSSATRAAPVSNDHDRSPE